MAADRALTIAVFHDPSGWALEDRYIDRIREVAEGRLELRRATSASQLADMLPGSTHLIGLPVSEDQITAIAPPAGTLQWVQLTQSIGDATPAVTAAVRAGVQVCSAASIRAPAIAEHGLTLLAALTRRLGDAIHAQSEHRWTGAELSRKARLISSLTVGIIASGPVAASLHALLRATGATIRWALPSDARPFLGFPDNESAPDGGAPLPDLLAECDAVIVACPRIPSHTGMLGKHEFARIRRGAMVIDLAGGGVVSEAALLDALRRDRVSAAALDGFEREPLTVGAPWWTMPNVIVTPRLAGAAEGYWDRAIEPIADNLRRALTGEACADQLPASWVEDAALARR